METADLSDIFLFDDAIWLVNQPEDLSNFKVLLSVFSLQTWLTLAFTLFITSLLWYLFAHCGEKPVYRCFHRCLIDVFHLSMNTGLHILPSSNTLRILMITYVLYSMHVNSYFLGKLGSILTHPGFEKGITNIEELAESTVVRPFTYQHHRKLMLTLNDSIAQKLGKKVVNITSFDFISLFDYMLKYKNTSLSSYESIIKYYAKEQSKLKTISGRYLLNMEATYATRRGHPLLDDVNRVIKQILEMGLQKKWLSDMSIRSFEKSNGKTQIVLSLEHLQGAFIVLLIGYSISVVIFLLEVTINKVKKSKLM